MSGEAKQHTELRKAIEQNDWAAAHGVVGQLLEENDNLRRWIKDLQSGMYVNCVYCGHWYGPKANTPVSMANLLKAHIQQCPEHPMSALKKRHQRTLAKLRAARTRILWLEEARSRERDRAFQNSSPADED